MMNISTVWNAKQSLLKEIILKPERFHEAVELCLAMHALVHPSEMSNAPSPTYEDQLWDGLTEAAFRAMPTSKDATIAWNIWHLSRIEDLTVNLLIADDKQVFDDQWLAEMNVSVRDTGNAMTDEEIMRLSSSIEMEALRKYRIEVGRKTQDVVRGLQPSDMKRKVQPAGLKRIFDEGGVLEESSGLLDFWGRKTVAGLLLMPVTRHQIVHINDSLRLKKKYKPPVNG